MRLRRWLLAGAVLLLAVLAGLVGYARHRAHTALLDLPHRLGIDIKSETDGFTYSQTVKGRTLFTLHAARAIQHSDGKTTLRNVQVTLFGEPGSNRVDRIRGAEFEYDQANGIVRAMGESEIDLAAPADADATRPDVKRIHVEASGLVFDQKAGIATTDGDLHFEYGSVHGNATGAAFDAHTGMLQLRHDVHLVSEESGTSGTVDADAAVLDRSQRTATLTRAIVTQAQQSLRARQLVVRLRPQAANSAGSIEQVSGTGGVELRAGDGATALAPTLEASVSPQNRPHEAVLTGGVLLRGPQGDGHSATATVRFDDRGRASHVRLVGSVDLRQAPTPGSTRTLVGDSVDGTLSSSASGPTVLQQAIAVGHASLHLVDAAVGKQPARESTLAANTLHATGASVAGRWQMRTITGDGATRVEERDATGEQRVSTGAHVDILLAPAVGPKAATTGGIESFVQAGQVHLVQREPARQNKAASVSTADAQRAEFDAGTGAIVLTGSPVVRSETMQLEAARIQVARDTGDAEATGAVKGTVRNQDAMTRPDVAMRQDAAEGAVHFLAERAVTSRSTQQATLFGGARPVRLWNGTSQLEAPVVELDQARGILLAHDISGGHATLPVRAILPAGAGAGKAADTASATRIFSQALLYRQATGAAPATAEFTGSVRLDNRSGQVQADRAVALLRQAPPRAGASTGVANLGGAMPGGAVETVTATGHVRVLQPGRTAVGTRLVYTAASQQFVLTGAPGDLPSVHDSVQGTVTGTSLLFHAGDDSVEVTGGPGQPVRTELDAPPRSGTNRGKTATPAGERKK